ncbi:hypothetical protein BX600DRAFT_552738 [Xylariales sp. PMI_506]|nr:hypothetical protein BX600DRAFT_552738 [Xylariales sp. PMI_506]
MESSTIDVPSADAIQNSLTTHNDELWRINQEIHGHPELAFKEFHAHDTICNYLEGLGYSVTRHAYSIQTSFECEVGSGGGVLVFNAEYDALPGIGHACGHNLIATSSLAAFLATAEVIQANKIEGRVRLLGTPAEEDGGGKIELLKAGAYKDVDACMMGHPGPRSGVESGVVQTSCMALAEAKITFHGVNAHAGLTPWLGKNALDACVAAYVNVSMLRQQIEPNQRIHAIISHGGDKPNIIPHVAEIQLVCRAEVDEKLRDTIERLEACCEGAAKAAGCTVTFNWTEIYKDLQTSDILCDMFHANANRLKQTYLRKLPGPPAGASTDQGNVSYEVPSIHPGFGIKVTESNVGPHHPKFRDAAGTRDGFQSAINFGAIMAATGIEVLRDSILREKLWAEHKRNSGGGKKTSDPAMRDVNAIRTQDSHEGQL